MLVSLKLFYIRLGRDKTKLLLEGSKLLVNAFVPENVKENPEVKVKRVGDFRQTKNKEDFFTL